MPFLDRFTSSFSLGQRSRPPIILKLNHTTGSSAGTMLVAPDAPHSGATSSLTLGGDAADEDSEWEYEYDSDAPEGFRRKTKKTTKKERKVAKKAAKKEAARAKREELGKETKKERKEQKKLAQTVLIRSLDETAPGASGTKEGGGCLMYE